MTLLCVGVCVVVTISLCGSLVGFGLGGLCGWSRVANAGLSILNHKTLACLETNPSTCSSL